LDPEKSRSSVAKGGTVENCGEMERTAPGKWCFVIVLKEGRQAQIMAVFISIMLREVR
jgi:hypothetical protein